MVEQLWYTWASTGLGGNTGYQIRAASRGLRENNSKRIQALRPYLNYDLPQGTDLAAAMPETSPVALTFLDIDKTSTPAEYSNTHVVMHKVLKGRDANGRPGVFFVHLIDMLPQGFVASHAIDLWASEFWRVSDESPPPPNHLLEEVREKDLRLGKLVNYPGAIAPYRNVIEKNLPYVIQAFLSLKPEQKLYILAPGEQVAALIWGLVHSLPHSLQKAFNLTFSTYEKDVSRISAKVVGTCRADVRTLYKNSAGRAQQPLPANAFTGSGPALAIDCETNAKAPLPQIDIAPALAEYAWKATNKLISGQAPWLAKKLDLATKQGIVDVVGFLSFIKTHIDEKELEPDEVAALLKNPRQAAGDLSSENARTSLLNHWTTQPEDWRKNKAGPALKNLSAFTVAGNTVLNANDTKELRDAFISLAKDATAKLVENLQSRTLFEALQNLLTLTVVEGTERGFRIHLIACLQEHERHPNSEQIQRNMLWEKRLWLLQQVAAVNDVAPVNITLIAPLLPQKWDELHVFLAAKELFPADWRGRAVGENISTTLRTNKPLPQSIARLLLEKHSTELFIAIKEWLQVPDTQPLALRFCIQLLGLIVKRKRPLIDALSYLWHKVIDVVLIVPRAFRNVWRYVLYIFIQRDQPKEDLMMSWQTVVIPVLGIEISAPGRPINLDDLLRAAQLQKEDQYLLVERYLQLLLSPSHLISPYVEKICGTFIDMLIEQAEELADKSRLHRFYSGRIMKALERLQQVNFSDKNRHRHVLDLLCLMITARQELFEWYFTQDRDFLLNLSGCIYRFQLSKDHTYMGNLYGMILKGSRPAKDLSRIIDQLAYLYEGEKSQKNHPEDKRRFFTEFVNYMEKKKKDSFSVETLALYVQLACECVDGIKEDRQKKFLVPVLKKIASTRYNNVAFKALDTKIKNTFASNPDYLKLWNKYGPAGSEQVVTLDGSSKQKNQPIPLNPTPGQSSSADQPDERGAKKPGDQSTDSKQDNSPNQSGGSSAGSSSDTPTDYNRGQAFSQPPDNNRGNFTPPADHKEERSVNPHTASGGERASNQSAGGASERFGDPFPSSNRGNPGGQYTGFNWEQAQDQTAASDVSNPSNQPAGGPQSKRPGGNFMTGQGSQSVGNEMGNQVPPQPIVTFRPVDILSTVLGQHVTKQQVGELAFAFKEYVPWRIDLLTKELAKLKNDANKQKGGSANSIPSQQYKTQAERDMLEELQFFGDIHQQIKRTLENDILIQEALASYTPEEQQMYQATLEDDYKKMQISSGYTNLTKRVNEGDIRFLFLICTRYCALASYLRKEELKRDGSSLDIKQWIEYRRRNTDGLL